MNNLDGPVIEAVSIPTTSKAMSSYELLRPLLLSDSEDELEFTMPHTIEDLVIKMKDISDELHDKLSRLLNFNGSIRRYLISDMSIEARFYQISETLMHSKVLLDLPDIQARVQLPAVKADAYRDVDISPPINP
ncbi:unnamed protein product [Hymenolepis diminuta]|uniref:Biogenesis of lysosome-related organelles complex 1 subunit 3 n=1 Tax=Hymenolepis diminuta TaxID=6216 RepID=A0A0R3SFK1_HYMDI|nr:unnamed protein product [Hymenolepis diminuta]